MLNQSREESARHGLEIERLLKTELKDTISYHFNKYYKTFERRLGITRDDLMNDMREQVWKGLLTHTPGGRANLKTYLNTLIKNRFGVLLKRSSIKKYTSIDYYSDVFTTTGIAEEHLVTEENGETIFERRQIIMQEIQSLSNDDRFIYVDLILGRSLDEMVELRGLTRVKVVGAINRIDDMIKRRLKAENE